MNRKAYKFIHCTVYGIAGNYYNVKNEQNRIIGHIDAAHRDSFVAGDNTHFRPVGNWQTTFSAELIRDLGLGTPAPVFTPGQAPMLQYNHDPRTLEDETKNEIIRQSAAEMLECLIQAESALFYAQTGGEITNVYTRQDVEQARARIRLALESIQAGHPAGL